jgi:hypothetical protein
MREAQLAKMKPMKKNMADTAIREGNNQLNIV